MMTDPCPAACRSSSGWIPPESAPLIGLGLVNGDLVSRSIKVLPSKDVARATLHHDATIIESHEQEALPH